MEKIFFREDCIDFYECLSIQHISFDEYNNFRHFHSTVIAEMFRGRLITLHLTVL